MRVAEASKTFDTFLVQTATPLMRMIVSTLRSEGYPWTVSTPVGSVRMSSDSSREDSIEFVLDTEVDPPQVIGRVHRARGSRTRTEDLPVKAGARPDQIDDDQVLQFLITALEPWLSR